MILKALAMTSSSWLQIQVSYLNDVDDSNLDGLVHGGQSSPVTEVEMSSAIDETHKDVTGLLRFDGRRHRGLWGYNGDVI